ncbi:MAG: LemA family protein [Phycisphaerales bacterium]|nr:LemA family protein [Phycisphaerales bacterium]
MNDAIRGTSRPRYRTVMLFLMIPLLAVSALLTQQFALGIVGEIRTLERIPQTTARASLPGPTKLHGNVEQAKGTDLVKGHWTDTPCVWYQALEEREETDSEGNTSWTTIFNKSEGVPFMITDRTGTLEVVQNDRVERSLGYKMRRTRGDRRYTEYRIDIDDGLHLVGVLGFEGDTPKITFPEGEDYVPIISDEPISAARASRGTWSTISIIISVFCTAGFCVCLMLGFRLFNTLGFAIVVGSIQTMMLLGGGLLMMSNDLSIAHRSVEAQLSVAHDITTKGFEELGIGWDGDWTRRELFEQAAALPDPGPRLQEIRTTIAARTERTREVRARFPQNLLAWSMDIPPTPEILAVGEVLPNNEAEITTARPSWIFPLVITLVSMIMAALGITVGFGKVRLKRLIENIPTTPATEADIGICELSGRVEYCEDIEPLTGPLTEQPCVWYRYLVQQWRGSGKNRRLHTVSDRSRRQVFLCTDDSGSIPVDTQDARVISGRSPSRSRGRWVYTEWSLRAGDPLYVLGSAELDPATGDSLRMARDPEGVPYIVSNLPEDRIKGREISAGFWWLAIGVAASAAALLGLLLFNGRVAAVDQILAAITSSTVVVLVVMAIMYNDLVFLRQRAKWAFSNIDVALKKRFDLLPQLQSIAEGYMKHEAEIQPALASLRAAWSSPMETPDARQAGVDASRQATDRLIALRERYPDLKADTVMDGVMKGIVTLENEIAARRDGYNAAVERYRARTHAIPEVILARLFRFRDMSLLVWESTIRDLDQLDFTRDERPTEEHGQDEITIEGDEEHDTEDDA